MSAPSPDWLATIAIGGLSIILSSASALITASIYIGNRKAKCEATDKLAVEIDAKLDKVKSAFEAYTGRTVNGADYRRH